VRFSVLVNGTPNGFFSSSHDLKQGDHLSPLMFVIVMEALDRMIYAVVSGGLLSGFYMGSGIDISHLLFADDMLIFSRADPDRLRHLWCLILCFEVVSSLKVNLAKLVLVPMGNVDVDGLVDIMGCGVLPLPLKYLGLPPRTPTRPRLFGMKLLKR